MATANNVQIKSNRRNRDGPELITLDASLLSMSMGDIDPVYSNPIRITQANHESIVFIWFDPEEQSGLNLVGPLRAINDNVQAFIDGVSCINAIKSSNEKIFFITTSSNHVLISTVHNLAAVEAIFILNPTVDSIRGDFPKLSGIFDQQEELFRVIKEVFDIFEQIQFEIFLFEQDKMFLWSQLYKEEVSNSKFVSLA
jgi:hypothetical protein